MRESEPLLAKIYKSLVWVGHVIRGGGNIDGEVAKKPVVFMIELSSDMSDPMGPNASCTASSSDASEVAIEGDFTAL